MMRHYLSINDIDSLPAWVEEARRLKSDPRKYFELGRGKTLGLLFFNNSLRTRLSTQKAAMNLGMDVMVMNFGNEGWTLEYQDGAVMDKGAAEHVKEAARVISQYCDIVGIRAFAGLKDKARDEAEEILSGFTKYSEVPLINMESSLSHPLQALADAITIAEHSPVKKPKIVLSWAPHPRPLPHAVANSFVRMMQMQGMDFTIANPEGYDLDPAITKGVPIVHEQDSALAGADIVYVKNWSSYSDYGKVHSTDPGWMLTKSKLGTARFMHCLPVRRNVVVEDAVLDSPQSLIIEQANNRTYAAQIVLKKLLEQA